MSRTYIPIDIFKGYSLLNKISNSWKFHCNMTFFSDSVEAKLDKVFRHVQAQKSSTSPTSTEQFNSLIEQFKTYHNTPLIEA